MWKFLFCEVINSTCAHILEYIEPIFIGPLTKGRIGS